MKKMLTAKAVARIGAGVTFARIVLLGPVLKNRQKHAAKITIQHAGNGVTSISSVKTKPANIPPR